MTYSFTIDFLVVAYWVVAYYVAGLVCVNCAGAITARKKEKGSRFAWFMRRVFLRSLWVAVVWPVAAYQEIDLAMGSRRYRKRKAAAQASKKETINA